MAHLSPTCNPAAVAMRDTTWSHTLLPCRGASIINLEQRTDCPPLITAHCRRLDRGFTYIGLLILVAIICLVSAAVLQTGSIQQRHAAEEELLEIGNEFRNALISYANATPAGQHRAPRLLQDLVKDPRYPNPRRHLRRIYADPITGVEEWGTVEALDGSGIIGVYSLSDAKPIKVDNFDHPFQDFMGKESYGDWLFMIGQDEGAKVGLPSR